MICFLLVGALSIPALVGCSGNSSPDQATGGSAKAVQPRTSIDCAIEGGTTAVAVSNDGKVVITQGYGKAKNVQIWDVKKQQKLHEFDNTSGSVLPVAIAPDGKTCAYTTYHAVSLREVGTGKELRQLRPKERALGFPKGLTFSSGGDLLIVAGGDHVIGWDPATGEQRLDWKADDKEVTALSNFFDNGKKIASGTEEGTVKVWEVATGKLLKTLPGGPREKVVSIAVTRDGKTLASVTNFQPIQVWDVSAGTVRKTIKGTPAWAPLLFLPDGQTLLYPDREHNIVLENAETGAQRYMLRGHTKHVWSLALTPDGSTLVSGGEDKTIKLWDLKSLP
jgi:hypothetical protein